jgi:polyhydroxyalkanoate synthesis regulator phasin
MIDPERNQVLKMIEDGKITPEEGLKLMQALDQNPAEDESAAGKPEAGSTPGLAAAAEKSETQTEKSNLEANSRIDVVKSTAQRLWQIPLWIGIGITVLSALGMYGIMRGPGMNFWFYFLMLPLFLGVVVIVAAVGSRRARWIFVDVHHKSGDWPERIFLGFPLPLKLAAWFLRTFGDKIPDLKKTSVDEIIQVVEAGFTGSEPLIVNAEDGNGGERVRVYIG